MQAIEIRNLTKDFGQNRGIFNISLKVKKGEAFGFVGANGAGKTTLIRHLLGFLKPTSGQSLINNYNCWTEAALIKKSLGYIAGEIAFPNARNGADFLKKQAQLHKLKDMHIANQLIQQFQLDTSVHLKKMSKGMKQKTAIIASFMIDPDILILDEPTTGLDPLMRNQFIELINYERAKGKTIFMSSHIFEELEQTCDQISFIKDGRIINSISTEDIKRTGIRLFKILFANRTDKENFLQSGFQCSPQNTHRNEITVTVPKDKLNLFITELTNYSILTLQQETDTLKAYFQTHYETGGKKNV